MPSAASSVLSDLRNARISMSIALSIGASRPSSTASMMSRVAIGGRFAISRARALASLRVSPSFVSRLARPSARHSGAGTCVPRIRYSRALVRPMRRGSRCEPPKPGVMPRFDSVCPIRAVSFTRRKWHAIAISQPPPSACPLIAAMTGFANRSIFRTTLFPKRMNVSTSPPANAEPRSAPAQKMRSPAPVMMTARTESSFSTELSAAFSSRMSGSLIALAGGRLSVMIAKLSSRANSRVSYAMGTDSLEEDCRNRVGRLGEAIPALAQNPRGRQLVHRAEQHLGGDLHGQVSPDQPGADALLEHVADHAEVGGHFVRGGTAEELLPLPQLDLDDLGEIGILLEHLEMEGHDLPDLRQRVALGGEFSPYQRDPLRHLLAEQGDEDLVLGLEVEVDRAARDARLAGDVRDARVVVAAAGEDADRGGNDLLRLVGIAHRYLTEPPFILRAPECRINPDVVWRRAPRGLRVALKHLPPANTPLELDVVLPCHPGEGLCDHLARPTGPIPEEIDDHGGHGPRRHYIGEMGIDDLVVGGVARAACAAHVRMQHRDHLAQVAHVGGARAVPSLAAGPQAEQGVGVLPEHACHRRVRAQREVPRQRLDLDPGAEGQRARFERAVDLRVGIADAFKGPAAHVRLEPRLARDDVHLGAAVGQDGVNADRVLVAEGFPQRVDRGERELRRVERVDAHVGRAAGVRRAPDEARRLSEPSVVGPGNTREAVLGTRRGVDHHCQVDVVQVAEAQQLALSAQELEAPRANLVEPPFEVAALFGGDGHERHAARETVHGPGPHEADRRAHKPRDLGVVAARVDRAGGPIRLRVSGDHESIELAHEGKRGAGPRAAGGIGPHPRDREPGPRGEAELSKLRLHQRRRPQLLEAELRVAPDRLPDGDDLVGMALDRFVDAVLELFPGHRLLFHEARLGL